MNDHDRPLNKRGKRACRLMGAFLTEQGLIPDKIICSTAARARQTVEGLLETLQAVSEVDFSRELYHADVVTMLEHFQPLSDGIEVVMLVGHNPGMEDLADRLVGSGARKAIARLAVKYPTGALAVIHFKEDSWADLAEGSGKLARFMRPKDLD